MPNKCCELVKLYQNINHRGPIFETV